MRFIDSFGFLSGSLENLGKTLDNGALDIFKAEHPDKWEYLQKKISLS